MTIDCTEFMGAGIVYIRNESGNNMQTFVSKLSHDSGSDNWFVVSASFEDDAHAKWNRSNHGWEVIAFKDDHNKRVGFYVDLQNVTTYVTFHSFSNVQIKQVHKTNSGC
ncbi:hypothetical protein E1B28_007909 [Marasmius oreades]|uniref:Uncharacterized protein n=1 Tax=Marasmius oreades TaxID=181124 RepID=A0A9P7UTY7_9AGAR|nr:uncharacterized protein E1B28_007909 [Marasmius oreades]KAG7094307.1 hypothetical protein E1B28_007909 [Marasmius oreades]